MTEEPPPQRSKWPIIVVVLSLVVLIATCGVGIQLSSTSDSDDAGRPTSVDSMEVLISIFDFRYAPGDISVPRGAEVTWVNDDKAPHTATERGSEWDTNVLSEGESAAITFTRPGTYDYFCTIHPYMTGKITVR